MSISRSVTSGLKGYALPISCMLAFITALLIPSGRAASQQKTLAEQLIGAWTYAALDTVRPDGSRTPMFGPSLRGMAIFDASGHYALLTARPDLPKFTSNNRMNATADEYKAVGQGSIAHFGRYTVDEVGKTITFRIDTSTFPNWNGMEQTRPFTITGDELRWTTPNASGGGTGEVVLKRAQ